MREIKFRVWCKQVEEMHTVEKMGFNEDGLWYVEDKDHDSQPPYFVGSDDWTLMQYTGLKDKNGREIYEGDIVKCFVKGDSKVIFKYGCFCLESLRYKNITAFCDIFGEMEVIGNIYEHSHLLED